MSEQRCIREHNFSDTSILAELQQNMLHLDGARKPKP